MATWAPKAAVQTPCAPTRTPQRSASARAPATENDHDGQRWRPERGPGAPAPFTVAGTRPCRFIPNRSSADSPWQDHCVRKLFDNDDDGDASSPSLQSPSRPTFRQYLLGALFDNEDAPRSNKILRFRREAIGASSSTRTALRDVFDRNRDGHDDPLRARAASHGGRRHISSTPERILDSPDLIDDYYLNLLHWGATNSVAIALSNAVYVWQATTQTTSLLTRTPGDVTVSSLRWDDEGTRLAIGTSQREVELWDVDHQRCVRRMDDHLDRVSVLAWRPGSRNVLTSAGRDAVIVNRDVRVGRPSVERCQGHTQEVCGLQWNQDGTQLASGGNDNLALIWDAKAMSRPRLVLNQHQAAVKALAWCPFEPRLLATGGGTADRCIRLWNGTTGACASTVDAGSQVCGLVWSSYERELLSAHGFSKNQLTIWRYPTMQRAADLVGHTSRVLHLSMSPDGSTVCSASADETLRFWKVFRAPARKFGDAAAARSPDALRTLSIR
ncbi:Anaphase-promoting complex subunit 4-like WD40 domain-containing protein [Plasmodiophora brassicae]|uniref:CDC20/Fizzy WD40 domain-containing protein n=1 Tax=Plasmodiophora brassicae TaxID=37360 RepID=A0A0G4II05_PLABS|nr:hypothetical protein PBRA_003679 [Plasmodiophora brassicae]SPQ94197.1 unnamed protein product [Plasmodiophora brassicae]